MLGCRRLLHACVQLNFASHTTEKSLLARLRKNTGYSIANCKKALEISGDDLAKAQEWLHAEAQKHGWTKAAKLQGRKTAEGLVGIALRNKNAAMVEVNCETDFVARNKEFQKLVQTAVMACLDHGVQMLLSGDVNKVPIQPGELGSITTQEAGPKTLSDLIALKIGFLGENIIFRRGVYVRAGGNVCLSGYTHPNDDASTMTARSGLENVVCLGKYGTLLTFQRTGSQEVPNLALSENDCGRLLCQHIIGMNPTSIGEVGDEPTEAQDEETKMIHQEFLLDPALRVSEFLQQHNVHLVDFVRFECGEHRTMSQE